MIPNGIGLLAAAGVAVPYLNQGGPIGGAIGMGLMMGGLAWVVSWLVFGIPHLRKVERAKQLLAEMRAQEMATVGEFKVAGLGEDAAILEKMFRDRDAIVARAAELGDNVDALHTSDLVERITAEASGEADELLDLARRADDPLLETPEGGRERIDEIRGRLETAYRAVADARTRLRRGDVLSETDFLADPSAPTPGGLEVLAKQLAEETAIAERVDARLRGEYAALAPSELEEDGEESEESARGRVSE